MRYLHARQRVSRFVGTSLLAASAFLAADLPAQRVRPMRVADYLDLEQAGDPQLSPDGKQVVSASFDTTLRVWDVAVDAMIAWTYANRYVPALTDEQRQRYGAALVGMDAAPTASATATP